MNLTFQKYLGTQYKTYLILFLCALIIGIKLGTLIPLEVPFRAAVYSSSSVEYSVGTVNPFHVYHLFVREAKLVLE